MSRQKSDYPVYPTLNMYSSSRVQNQRVNNSKIPLLKYIQPIQIRSQKVHDSDFVNTQYLRKFQKSDGLIHNIKNMNSFDSNKNMNIKILICVCMYNQSMNAISLTLQGIYDNLKHLKQQGIHQGDIAVVLVQDGILKLVSDKKKRKYAKDQKSMINFYRKLDQHQKKYRCDLQQRINVILDQTQNYQRKGIVQKVSNNRDIPPSIQKNIALVYQNLWRPSMINSKNSDQEKDLWLRLFSCFKHTNGTKLSSHLWFFQGFCRYLKPQFCVLLDVGTKPGKHGLLNLIRGFSPSPKIGGVSGFMSVDIQFASQQGGNQVQQQNFLMRNFFSIQRAQQYQYIISHFLDKNQQSALGFLHVLPGAWSAYRYQALIKSDKYQPNLLQRSYFKMILNPQLQQKDFAEANMYLAQDRILSLGIYCQMDSQYVLKYVPDAQAFTDPMKDHQNLMNQRRRWINSSLFAFLKYVTLNMSMWIALLSLFNTYISPSLYFFVLYATIYQLGFPGAQWVAKAACMFYAFVFMIAVGGALTGKSWSKRASVISAILAVFTFALLGLLCYNILITYLKITNVSTRGDQQDFYFSLGGKNKVLTLVFIMLVINFSCFLIILLMHIPTHASFVWKLIKDMSSYTAYTGAYSQTMVIHAFCNVDDVSWGTKGSSASGKNKYQQDKVHFITNWLLINSILAFIFLYIDVISRQNTTGDNQNIVLVAVAIYGTAFMLLKTIFAVYNHFRWLMCQNSCTKLTQGKSDTNRKTAIKKYWDRRFRQWMNNDKIKQ